MTLMYVVFSVHTLLVLPCLKCMTLMYAIFSVHTLLVLLYLRCIFCLPIRAQEAKQGHTKILRHVHHVDCGADL